MSARHRSVLPTHVRIREVGARDGFHNEPARIPPDDTMRLLELLARTGIPRLELTSFVRHDGASQLGDAVEVVRRAKMRRKVCTSVLVANRKALDAALRFGDRIGGICCLLSATDGHSRRKL